MRFVRFAWRYSTIRFRLQCRALATNSAFLLFIHQIAVHRAVADEETLYLLLMRFVSLILETIPKHPAYKDAKFKAANVQYKESLGGLMSELETLKRSLDAMDLQTEQYAAEIGQQHAGPADSLAVSLNEMEAEVIPPLIPEDELESGRSQAQPEQEGAGRAGLQLDLLTGGSHAAAQAAAAHAASKLASGAHSAVAPVEYPSASLKPAPRIVLPATT
eukprot:gene23911-29012_t